MRHLQFKLPFVAPQPVAIPCNLKFGQREKEKISKTRIQLTSRCEKLFPRVGKQTGFI